MLLSFNLCITFAYLSVTRVNGIGENSNFSSQLRIDFIVRNPFHTMCFSAVNITNTHLLLKNVRIVCITRHNSAFALKVDI